MRILVAFLGLFVGILAGLMVVIWNPSARIEPRFSLQTDEPTRLTILDSIARGSGAEPRSLLGLGGELGGGFSDPALRYARVNVAVLKPEQSGANALAVKLSAVSTKNTLFRGRLFANSVWLIDWPGHGSLFLVGSDDYWPMLTDAAWSALFGGGFTPTSDVFPLTERLQIGRFQGVVGATGALAGFAGRYQEWQETGGAAPGGYLKLEPHTL